MDIKLKESITQPTNAVKLKRAAIWARVSTIGQRETSLPSQAERVSATLSESGFVIPPEYTFSVNWSSLDLERCPEFLTLIGLIRRREIQAIGVFDRDRLAAEPTQRLIFLSECAEAGVEIIVSQGPPFIEGDEGQLVEMALTIGKKRAVLRARQGSKDGLHDRVASRGMPATWRTPYGYRWETIADKKAVRPALRLIPNADWPNVKDICDMLIKGSSYTPIIQELSRRGIPSPSGAPEWNKAALSAIIHNPTYAGRYYGLRRKAVEPQGVKRSSRVNSSNVRLPLKEAVYIPNVEIVDPPMTWDQRERILEQLARHQKLGQRNARRNYLLRGLILCGTHSGKRGEPRRYHGQPHYKSWRYVCPETGCAKPFLKGQEAEELAKRGIRALIAMLGKESIENIISPAIRKETKESLEYQLKGCQRKQKANLSAEKKVVNEYARGRIREEVYNQLLSEYLKEREHLQREQDSLLGLLAQIGHYKRIERSTREVVEAFSFRMDNLSDTEWRELFSIFNIELYIPSEKELEALGQRTKPMSIKEQLQNRYLYAGPFQIRFELPLEREEIEENVRGIISSAPGSVKHNVYPLRFSLHNFTTLERPRPRPQPSPVATPAGKGKNG